jgi:hypothetical protein
MADDQIPDFKFDNPFISSDGKSPSKPSEPAADRPGPALGWSANLPMNQERANSARAAWLKAGHSADVFDAAMKDDGFVPPNVEEEALLKAHGLSSGKAEDLKFEQALATKHSGEVAGLLTGMKLQPGLASAIGDYIAQTGPRLMKFDAHQRANWLYQEKQTGIKLCGSEAKLAAVKADAVQMLERATKLPADRGGDLARSLLKADLFNSAFVLMSLATQLQYFKAYDVAAKRKGIKPS